MILNICYCYWTILFANHPAVILYIQPSSPDNHFQTSRQFLGKSSFQKEKQLWLVFLLILLQEMKPYSWFLTYILHKLSWQGIVTSSGALLRSVIKLFKLGRLFVVKVWISEKPQSGREKLLMKDDSFPVRVLASFFSFFMSPHFLDVPLVVIFTSGQIESLYIREAIV